jgi:deoxycytidylate deaminase
MNETCRYLSWDDYFMAVAFLSSQRSKDPAKQVGACIVDCNNVICGIGYNGFPRGCPDSKLPWAKRSRNGNPLETKYPYVCHAEMNAILNKNGASVAGARVYVTMFPCNECAKLLIQAGIAEIIFHEDKAQPRGGTPAAGGFKLAQQYAASKNLLQLAGVKVRQHRFSRPVELILGNDQEDRPVVATRAAMDGSDDANRDATVRVATPATMGDPVNGGEYAVSPASAAEKVAPGSKKDEVNGKTLDFAEDSF